MHRRLLSLARDARFALALTILAGLLAGWLTIGQARGLSLLVARVFLGGVELGAVTGFLGLLLGVILLRALLAWLSEVAAKRVGVRVKADLRERLFAKLLALGPAYTRGERTGELTAAAVEGVEALDAYFGQYLPQLVITALVPLSVLAFVFPLDWVSGLVLLVTAPLIPFFMVLIGRAAEALTKRQYETLGRLSAHFLDSLQGLVTLKQFGRSKDHTRTIAEASDRFRDVTLAVLRVTFLSALALELLATLGTAIVAVEVGLRLLYGYLPFDKALFLLLLAPEFYIPLRMLGLRFHAGMAGTSAARRIFAILDISRPTVDHEPSPVDGGLPPTVHGPVTIALRSVSYTYPGDSQPILRDIDLELCPGEHLALVGPSGAGKSTLAALLLRFLEPTSGAISVLDAGGEKQPLSEIALGSWRDLLAWVPQDPHLFHDTIAANLRIANPDATQAQLEAAASAAHLDEFIRSLPQGYATVVGEEGARLSGGQAQRLALARAFLKDAPILVLDEPTSGLDPATEALLEESTRRLMQGRSVLTIAHRLNTVARADRILVLDAGRIVESGTHGELLKQGGLYAHMVEAAQGEKIGAFEEDKRGINASERVATISVETVPVPSIARRSSLATFSRLMGFLKGSGNWVALSILLTALTVGANVGLMGASTWLIASAALHPSIAELQVAIVGVRFFGLARGVFRYLERLVSHDVTFRLLSRLRTWFYEKLEPLAPARLAQYRIGDLLTRIVADVETLENFYVRSVAPPLAALVVVALTALFLGGYDPRLAWTYLGYALLLGLGLPLLLGRLGRGPGRALVARRAALRIRLVDGIQGLADLLAFGREFDYAAQVRAEGDAYGEAQRRQARLSGLASATNVLLPNLGMWSVLALSIPLVSSGRLEGVMLPVLALVALASFEALTPLPLAAQTLSTSLESARRLFEVVDVKPAMRDGQIAVGDQLVGASDLGPAPALHVSNLTFTYPGSTEPALQDVSFELPPGERLAVVGPSGAGKSTLVHLLQRFWEPPEGSIRLDGRDLAGVPVEAVRERIGVISQRTYLFNASILQNLLLARPDATQAQVEQAARLAQLHEFVVVLPAAYETMVGERGLRLSGGERQRLAIARVLLKDAPLLLLDEPTAHLDPLTERRILESLFELTRGHSLLLLTHRLVGLDAMDTILVLDHGRVVEHGTHAELLRKAGLYRSMYTIQNRILQDRD